MNEKYNCFIIIIFLLITLISCHKDFSAINNDVQKKEDIISLKVGNNYFFHAYVSGGSYYTDWYYTEVIYRDTIINGKKYHSYADGSSFRIEGNSVFENINGEDIIKFDFTVNVKDTITYNTLKLIVEEITEESVLTPQTIEKVFRTSNQGLSTQQIVRMAYSTRFGLISFSTEDGNRREGYHLIGAILDNKQYGRKY